MAPRIAFAGALLSTTPFGRPPQDKNRGFVLKGSALLGACRTPGRARAPENLSSFVRTLDATGAWTPVPVVSVERLPSGPLEPRDSDDLMHAILSQIEAARPLDAIYLAFRDNLASSADDDMMGSLLAGVRAAAGPGTLLVASVGGGADLSDASIAAADVLLPATSLGSVLRSAEGEKAALLVRLVLAGMVTPATSYVRLPLLWARAGTAFERLEEIAGWIGHRQALHAPDIFAAGLTGGLPTAGGEHAGLTVVAVGRSDAVSAKAFADEVAKHIWERRSGAEPLLMPIKAAVALARADGGARTILVDSGDRIDLGGSGRSTELLSALAWGWAADVLSIGHVDPMVVEQAHHAGAGARMRVLFNSESQNPDDAWFEADADVLGVAGVISDAARHGGPAAALKVGDVTVVVTARATLAWRGEGLASLGIDPAAARTVAMKIGPQMLDLALRRALPEASNDVDTPGATSPRFESPGRTKHPIYPLDKSTRWEPPQD